MLAAVQVLVPQEFVRTSALPIYAIVSAPASKLATLLNLACCLHLASSVSTRFA